MSFYETALGAMAAFYQLNADELRNCCRICKRKKDNESAVMMRALFDDNKLTRLIENTIHIKIKDSSDLPRFVCEKCVNMLKNFSAFQLNFRRSEEQLKLAYNEHPNFHMETLIAFSAELFKQVEKKKKKENVTKNPKHGNAKSKKQKLNNI